MNFPASSRFTYNDMTCPIMPEQLYQIAFPAPEAEDFAPMWVTAKALLHRQRKGVHAAPLMCCST